jgi:hypothetical protein
MEQVRDPSDADAHVSFYTKDVTVKADDGDDEQTTIEVPVSGLAEDRDGDKLADAAIDSMVAQINEGGVPMFPNHGYDSDNGVPQAYRYEDIIGGWVSAERDGEVVVAEGKLREGKQSAAELEDLLSQSLPVGFSIGFGWDEDNAEERDSGGLRFSDLDLMEISPVGIQSHPDAATTGGLKVASAMQAAGLDPDTIDTDDLTNALMTAKESDEDEDDEEMNDGDGGSTQKVTADEMDAVMELIDAHTEALKEDVRDTLEVTEGGDGEGGDDGGEETDADDGMDEDEDDEKTAELEEELEAVKAELEAVKTDAAGSQGPKGGMEVTDNDAEPDEQNDEQTQTTQAASVTQEAAEF